MAVNEKLVVTHNGVYVCEFEDQAVFDAFNWERFTAEFYTADSREEAIKWLKEEGAAMVEDGVALEEDGDGDDAYFHKAQGGTFVKLGQWLEEGRYGAGRCYFKEDGGMHIYPLFGNELRKLDGNGWDYFNGMEEEPEEYGTMEENGIPEAWENDGYVDPFDDSVCPAVAD